MSVAGIQETRWFGPDVWNALPESAVKAVRNEGVGIALDDRATAAWRAAGETWEAVSSRIVTVRLKIAKVEQRQHQRDK